MLNSNGIYEKLVKKVSDTGWLNVALSSGVNPASNGLGGAVGLQYRKIDNSIIIDILLEKMYNEIAKKEFTNNVTCIFFHVILVFLDGNGSAGPHSIHCHVSENECWIL